MEIVKTIITSLPVYDSLEFCREVGLCECKREIELFGEVNRCQCGRRYTFNGELIKEKEGTMVTQVKDLKVIDFLNLVQKLIDDGMDNSQAVKTARKEWDLCEKYGADPLEAMGRPFHEEHGARGG